MQATDGHPETPTEPGLTVQQARALAEELIGELAQHVGDPDAIDDVGRRWLEVLDAPRLCLVGLAALRTVFRDCLTLTDPADWPPGGLAFTPADREDTP